VGVQVNNANLSRCVQDEAMVVVRMTVRGHEGQALLGTLAVLLVIYTLTYLVYVPNEAGEVANDYSLWIPDLLAGYFWHLNNKWFALPWFSPAQCGGVPFYADPQVGYLSVPQFLTFVIPPIEAIQASILFFATVGFLGSYYLARVTFRVSAAAALIAGTVFMFNNFYASRMLVGHLTYQPFMLAPALAAAILPKTSGESSRFADFASVSIGGIVVAAMIQGGAVHVVPPALMSVTIIAIIYGIRFGMVMPAALRLAETLLVGCALAASKLVASAAFLTNFPRDQYSLPGIDGLGMTIWRALQTLFVGQASAGNGGLCYSGRSVNQCPD
jgi:hypothetical protein